MRSQSRRTFADVIRIRPVNLFRRLTNRLRIAHKDIADAHEKTRAVKAGATPQERQEELIAFYARYEDLVELLCDAAQYGPTSRLESRYEETRAWLQIRYGELKPLLRAFLRPSPGTPSEENQDAFESLLSPGSVSDFLHSDDGETIDRITRTREALNLYGEHLRQLAERTG